MTIGLIYSYFVGQHVNHILTDKNDLRLRCILGIDSSLDGHTIAATGIWTINEKIRLIIRNHKLIFCYLVYILYSTSAVTTEVSSTWQPSTV